MTDAVQDLVAALATAGLPVVIANPRQVRDFAKATGQLAKTDALDAGILALFAERVRPTPRPLPDADDFADRGLRYFVKRLRAALPDVRIVVGRWAPPALADDSTQLLRDSGASLVASTLLETRTYLAALVESPRIPVPEPTVRAA